MHDMLLWAGRLAGAAGLVLCGLSLGARLAGVYWLGSFQVGTLLNGGIAAMLAGCLAFLAWLVEETRLRREGSVPAGR